VKEDVGNVACMQEMRNIYKVLFGILEGREYRKTLA
jgi:hypothetical protein